MKPRQSIHRRFHLGFDLHPYKTQQIQDLKVHDQTQYRLLTNWASERWEEDTNFGFISSSSLVIKGIFRIIATLKGKKGDNIFMKLFLSGTDFELVVLLVYSFSKMTIVRPSPSMASTTDQY